MYLCMNKLVCFEELKDKSTKLNVESIMSWVCKNNIIKKV